ncbi:transcription factor [Phlyctema vagabunda]|uniref:Transcription factor n=1 Tax=Phlyctema vagabunda TaxID=108571 RepID=A0ABR4PU11_9HELO
MDPLPDEPMERLVFQTSSRKIKCDRVQPCARCAKAKTDCIFRGTGEKQRPVSKAQVQALEAEIKSLRAFITRLSNVDQTERDEMLVKFNASGDSTEYIFNQTPEPPVAEIPPECTLPIRPKAGHLRKLKDGKAAQFYGPTSLFQISPADDQDVFTASVECSASHTHEMNSDIELYSRLAFAVTPQSDVCLHAMATFFIKQYQYHMCVYREYFLRDLDAGGGPYYSELLFWAICSLGSLASDDAGIRGLSDLFAGRAQDLLYGTALEVPNLTTLQALLLLGHRAIGRGNASKGWLYSGMAFRLAHEMGLHLDPSNWKGSQDSRVEREILRRVYWAVFIADKQLSLYFGRPPALYPGESDVRNTIRIPYPPEWQALLEKYLMKSSSEAAYEDGIALVASWIYLAELSKIQHRMLTEVFENRNSSLDPTVLASKVTQIHVALTKWLQDLPSKLHWTKWTVGPVPSNIIHLHMVFHTAVIILRRPARHVLQDASSVPQEDINTCYESLDVIVRLLKVYSRHYDYSHLPLTFVHTLASAASVILMKRYITATTWDDSEIVKPLELILGAIDKVSITWPCVKQVRQVLDSAMKTPTRKSSRTVSPGSFDFIAGDGLMKDLGFDQMDVNEGGFDPTTMADFDLGTLMTDDFMNHEFSWDIGLSSATFIPPLHSGGDGTSEML